MPYPLPTPAPEFEFPKFSGTNPKLWIKRCETYFDLYQTDPIKWICLATMKLTGSAALWWQTQPKSSTNMTWESFVTLICARFDKDEHNHILHHFFNIKHTTTVVEYVEEFSDIVHHLLADGPSFPPSAIAKRFVDGLKKDIRAVDLDTASSLAVLQEEALQDEPIKRFESFSGKKKKHDEDDEKTSTGSSKAVQKHSEDKKA